MANKFVFDRSIGDQFGEDAQPFFELVAWRRAEGDAHGTGRQCFADGEAFGGGNADAPRQSRLFELDAREPFGQRQPAENVGIAAAAYFVGEERAYEAAALAGVPPVRGDDTLELAGGDDAGRQFGHHRHDADVQAVQRTGDGFFTGVGHGRAGGAQARRDHFRHRGDVDTAFRREARHGGHAALHELVGTVLDQQRVVGAQNGGDLAAAVFRQRGGGGVVAGGDQIDSVDLFAAAETFEVSRFHALFAASDRDEFDAEHGGGRLDAGIRVVVHGDLFAAAEQRGEDGRDRVLGAVGEQDLFAVRLVSAQAHERDGGVLLPLVLALGVEAEQRSGLVAAEERAGHVQQRGVGRVLRLDAAHVDDVRSFGTLEKPFVGERAVRHERAAADGGGEQPLELAELERLGHGADVDVEKVGQLALRRQTRAGLEGAGGDIVLERARQRQIERTFAAVQLRPPAHRIVVEGIVGHDRHLAVQL